MTTGMDPEPQAIRSALLAAGADGTAPALEEGELAEVLSMAGWIVITLGGEAARDATAGPVSMPRIVTPDDRDLAEGDAMVRVHRRLHAAFPAASIEVRAGSRIYRGGAGFGEGKHVLAVLGGKGGVGKSTVAVNLALTLTAMGFAVGLIDGDLNGPDVPHMLGVSPKDRPRGRTLAMSAQAPSAWRRPLQRYGVEIVSVGLEVPERFPPIISSRMLVAALLRGFIFQTAWSADVLLIDAPPGTGEELQVMAHELPLSGAIFVTTPQDLAQMDAERSLTLLREGNVPVLGMVQNMATLTCPHCTTAIDMYRLSPRLMEAGVSVLGRIPFDVQLSVTADEGRPLVLGDPRGPIAREFAQIGGRVRRWLAERDRGEARARA
ncbi:MAG TPA: P-loop NTPase [Dehalococcoidia bacterium]|jgi:ATP-binding protein involved in chromosome partitioning